MDIEIKELVSEAAAALTAGETAKAQELYQSVLDRQSDSVDALYALGTIAFQEKDYQRALELLGQAAEAEPEAVDIAFNYASVLATVGDRLGALLQLQRATQHCRDDAYFVPRIADMSIRLGEPAAAVTLLSRLQRLTPADQIILANAQGMLGSWREAVGILKFLHDSVPEDPVVAEKLALAASKLRDYDLSIRAFERYLRLVKPTARDYLRFADLLLIAQLTERCEQALKIAEDMGEESAELFMLRARTARLKGDNAAVQVALGRVLERQSKNGQAWSIKAELAADDELAELITELSTELAMHAELAEVSSWHQALLHYALASMQARVTDYSAASQSLLAANELQYKELLRTDSFYNPEASQVQTGLTIKDYPAEVCKQPGAPLADDQNSKTPIFIVGMPRSGTTLVERILGQNAQVYCAGEQEAMEFVAAHYKHQVSIGRLENPSAVSSAKWAELRSMYLEKLPEISKPIFTDKLPHNFRNVGLILKLFPDAKIIQMHRDPKDISLSIYQRAFAPGHNYANRWDDLKHFNAQADRYMAHWSSLQSSQIMDLQYEDLVRDPQIHARQLIEFVGFKWDDGYLDFHESTSKSFTFSEMQVREPITDKRIGAWQHYVDFFPELSTGW